MRIARVAHEGRISFGVIEGDEVAELDGPPIGELRFSGARVALADCRLLAPVLPSKVVCVGRNYADHAAEMGAEAPPEPLLFLKPSTAVIGPDESIRKPAITQRLDHEGELAVVVAGLVRNADLETAARSILGYTCANDVTARDIQRADGQWTRGKGFDSFCPLGPWIDTAIEGSGLDVEVRLNGEVRQHGNTADMFFSPAFIVSYVSHVMTLLPGDVILTGTPSGVGPMQAGDICEVEIAGLGVLRNPVEDAS